ncbi:MAG: leucyl aminopeptidase family protein [Erysipelothrix sp.]|nr:leucyl aminopeptidase family protein [Erysipelothrix sp.]
MIFKYEQNTVKAVSLPVIYPVYENCDLLIDGLSIKKESGHISSVPTLGHLKAPVVVYAGLGDKDVLQAESFQLAIRKAAQAINGQEFVVALEHLTDDHLTLLDLTTQSVHAIGDALYSYRDKKDYTVTFIGQHDVSELLESQQIIQEAVDHTKDLVNKPSNLLTPLVFEEYLVTLAKEIGVEITTYDNDALEELGAGGILSVNKGSHWPARLVVLKYQGANDEPFSALVGKGVTFDSGGYNLKPSNSMATMKCDMGGAASVVGAFEAIVRLKKEVNVYAIVVLTENMINGAAYKVDDVITMMNKKTVEVTNTDAEGRIVLGDALVHATNLGVKTIVDVATLTGACVVALGNEFTGLFSNSPQLTNSFTEASQRTHEKLWQLPLSDNVSKSLKDTIVADLVNSTGKPPGATVAAAFLQEFIGEDIDWVHLDIAGTAFLKSAQAKSVGATGVMVKTIFEALTN